MVSVIPKITHLSSRVLRVLGCNPGYFTLQGTNTYIIGTGRQRALLDCGEPDVPDYINLLRRVVEEEKISLSKIILTHWHPDHAGGAKQVLEQIAEKDCQVFKYREPIHDRLFAELFPITYLRDQDEVEVEGATMKVHLTPGHSKDHLIVTLKEEDVMFSGDCILGEGSVVFEDLITYLQSLQRILTLNPGKLYPGHGPVVEKVVEKVNDYIKKRMDREAQILGVLADAKGGYMTAKDIVDKMYKNLPPSLMFGAEYNVRNHLDKLVKESRVDMVDGDLVTEYRLKEDA